MNEEKALALPAVGKVLDVLGLGAGIGALVDPSGTSGIASATIPVVRAVISHLEDRADTRRQEHTRLLLEDLRSRVANLEAREDKPVELFEELLRRAIEDDDKRKVPFQGAIIGWVAVEHPDASLARMAMTAVATLASPELRAFVTWYHRDGRMRVERGWSDTMVWARLYHAGLMTDVAMIQKSKVTRIGRVLAEGCASMQYSDAEWQSLP